MDRTIEVARPDRSRLTAIGVCICAALTIAAAIWGHGVMVAGHQTDARAGYVPWALAAFFGSMGVHVASLVLFRRLAEAHLVRISGSALAGALGVAMLFFAGLGLSERISFLQFRDGSVVGASITFLVSVVLLLLIPISLVVFAVAVWFDRRLPVSGRVGVPVVVAAAAAGIVAFALAP